MQCSDRFDLTDRVFGRLTALECVEGKRSKGIWECRCECGAVKRISYHTLTQGLSKSCGCARRQADAERLSGQKFGRLTAIERTNEKKGTNFIWRCRCDCGREIRVSANLLLNGSTKSCGCLRMEGKNANYRDFAGQRFGRLVAIEPIQQRSGGSVMWKCRCDCGRESIHASKTLISGRTQSCGCLKRANNVLQEKLHYINGTCVEFLENTEERRRDNTSGCRGLKKMRGKWQVCITFKKRTYYLGTYADKEEAIRIRRRAEQAVFGKFLDWYNAEFSNKPTLRQQRKTEQPQKQNNTAG